jgi:hypothetical protein
MLRVISANTMQHNTYIYVSFLSNEEEHVIILPQHTFSRSQQVLVIDRITIAVALYNATQNRRYIRVEGLIQAYYTREDISFYI